MKINKKKITDKNRLDWLEKCICDIDAPFRTEAKWVVYRNESGPAGEGDGTGESLRSAIDAAILKWLDEK